MRTSTLAALALASVLHLPAPLAAQEPEPLTPLFSGTSLDGWKLPQGKSNRFLATAGVLRVTGDSGWLLTQQPYDDFVLTFEARSVGRESAGGVLVRTLVLPKHRLAYEVQVSNGDRPSPVLLQHYDKKTLAALGAPPALVSVAGEWHRYRVECVEDRIGVFRDEAEIAQARGLALTTGSIGVHALHGVVELRNMRIHGIEPRRLKIAEGTARATDLGVTAAARMSPKSAPPSMPPLAVALGLVGEVALECVVAANGQVHQCVVTRRFFGPLDEEVLRAALRMRFDEPATRDGKPVPVVMSLRYHFDCVPTYHE
jgi:TonB family protein